MKERAVFLTSSKQDHRTLQYIHWKIDHGAEVRIAPRLPIRMIIFDRNVAVLPLNLKNALAGIAVYRNQALVEALRELFECVWLAAQTVRGPDIAEMGLSDSEIAILKMLAQGKTDTEIGKRLGVVGRTVRRRVKRFWIS